MTSLLISSLLFLPAGWAGLSRFRKSRTPFVRLFWRAERRCVGGIGVMVSQRLNTARRRRAPRLALPTLGGPRATSCGSAFLVWAGRGAGEGRGRTPNAQGDSVNVGGWAVASVPFDAGTDDHGGAVVVLPDEIGGRFPLLGLARFNPLQIADDVGVVAPIFHCFAAPDWFFSTVFRRSMTSL